MPVASLRIDSIAAGGDGVARADGMVVFVPRTAPGDVARVSYEPKGRFARGALMALESASPDRVAPSCVHYEGDRCGGCQLQHMSYGAGRALAVALSAQADTRAARPRATVDGRPASVRPTRSRVRAARVPDYRRSRARGVARGARSGRRAA